jgi:response regulator RpfG family c-di-GMP phosphodiesterase
MIAQLRSNPTHLEPAPANDSTPAQQPRVLIIDDDPDLLTLGRRLLESSGRRCVTAESHTAAFGCLESNRDIGTVILASETAGRDMDELIHSLRLLRPGLTLIGTSTNPAARSRFLDLGVSRFTPKPWRPSHLFALLGR